MEQRCRRPLARVLACLLSLSVASCLMAPAGALADPEDEIAKKRQRSQELLEEIERATSSYQEATESVTAISRLVEESEARAADIERRLPAQRARTAASVKSIYLLQQSQSGLLELLVSAESFNDFITTLRYLDTIHARNVSEIRALATLDDELSRTRAELVAERDAAIERQSQLLVAMQEVSEARSDLEEEIRVLEDEAREAADRQERERMEQLARETAQAAEEAVSALPETIAQLTEPHTTEAPVAPPEALPGTEDMEQAPLETIAPETPEAPVSETQVEEAPEDLTQAPPEETPAPAEEPAQVLAPAPASSGWAGRIDAYLAGSPLEGYGSVFADAAASAGIDPRISPAIAAVESGKGSICFLPHNAWGWGSSSWSDWESAIQGHVAGFASVYGGALSAEMAATYAGPDIAAEWYALVMAEMSSI